MLRNSTLRVQQKFETLRAEWMNSTLRHVLLS